MRALYPVIHYRDRRLAVENARIAQDAGCAGVFLINMEGDSLPLFDAAGAIAAACPALWLGVNRLDVEASDAVRSAGEAFDGVWADHPGLFSGTAGSPPPDRQLVTEIGSALEDALLSPRARQPFRFFGSVAFKGQPSEPRPDLVAVEAARLGWTATTSGARTGVAPDVAKVAAMSAALEAVSGARLAVASGITPENVAAFLPYVDDFLVATGISQDFHHFDPARVAALQRRIAAD